MRRLLLVLVALLGLALVAPLTASAQGSDGSRGGGGRYPDRIELPDGFRPEGIQVGRGTTVYVGSLADGRIWRGDVRTGRGRVWAPAVGAPAVGLTYDPRTRFLWVAGGVSGQVRVYDTRNAELLRTYTVPAVGAEIFLNDLTVTRRAVYVTDSRANRLVVIPLRRGGHPSGPASSLALRGDIPPVTPGAANLNGIVDARGWLLVAHTAAARLYRVDARTGVAREVDTRGASVENADGLELRGRLLYVVRNRSNLVQRFVLGSRLLTAHPVGTLTGDTDVPTTGTYVRKARALYVVNARFGNPTPDTASYWITRLGR